MVKNSLATNNVEKQNTLQFIGHIFEQVSQEIWDSILKGCVSIFIKKLLKSSNRFPRLNFTFQLVLIST